MKFKNIDHFDNFDDEVIFWIEISHVPSLIQNKAKLIDGKEYNPGCFGMCIAYDVDSKKFDVIEKETADKQKGNIFYVNNDGDRIWFKAEISHEFKKKVFEKCRKILSYEVKTVSELESMLFYSQDKEQDAAHGCIGHLRADFGRDGEEFWTSWNDHCEELKTQAFKNELDEVINHLREKENMLNSLRALTRYCYKHTEARFKADHRENTYGFKIETEAYSYYLRCNILQGDYNLYCYCYVRETLDKSLAASQSKEE